MQRTARSGQSCLLLAADRTPTALFGTVYETVGLTTRGFTIYLSIYLSIHLSISIFTIAETLPAVVPFLVPSHANLSVEPPGRERSADAQWQARTSRGRAC